MSQIIAQRPSAPADLPTTDTSAATVALGHDYLTQRGGAERVVEAMARAFPGAPVYTTLYDAEGTFPSIAALDVRPSALNRIGPLRRRHRLALPFLRSVIERTHVEADVLLTSSSGWAHGMSCSGRKVVYCHAPARWLYQEHRYLGAGRDDTGGVRRRAAQLALRALGGGLRCWDREAALSADRYLVNSTVVQRAVLETYGIVAEVVAPPPAMLPVGPEEVLPGLERPFLLCVARLLPYKNVDVIIEAVRQTATADLVVVGTGPDRARLESIAAGDPGIHLVGRVTDAQLRWLYGECLALVAASHEDYGLTPLEAAAHGRPTIALRDGGFLDTVSEGITGVFFDEPTPEAVGAALAELPSWVWDSERIRKHADTFGEDRFAARLQQIVADELS